MMFDLLLGVTLILSPDVSKNLQWLPFIQDSYSNCVIGVDGFNNEQPNFNDEKTNKLMSYRKLSLDLACDGISLLRDEMIKDEDGERSDFVENFIYSYGAHPITTFSSHLIKVMHDKKFKSTGCSLKSQYYPTTNRTHERLYCSFSR